jgi:uncharacterized FAD-dependent dehydrogenase
VADKRARAMIMTKGKEGVEMALFSTERFSLPLASRPIDSGVRIEAVSLSLRGRFSHWYHCVSIKGSKLPVARLEFDKMIDVATLQT